MAVLKHSSPTACPSAPKPWPQATRPSANTSTPVAPLGWGAGAVVGAGLAIGWRLLRDWDNDVAKRRSLSAWRASVNGWSGRKTAATAGRFPNRDEAMIRDDIKAALVVAMKGGDK